MPGREARVRRFLAARLDPRSALGLELTAGVLLVALCVWLFGALLEEVLDRATLVRWDMAAEAWIVPHTTAAGRAIFVAITRIGSPGVPIIGVVVGLVLLLRRDWLMLLTWAGAVGGGKLIEGALKATVHRQRPVFAAAYLREPSSSFPSAHAMSSTLCFATLAWILIVRWPWARRHRVLVALAAAAVIGAVTASRLYLGVHYPSDVAGGLLAGAAWVTACISAARVAMRRGAERGRD